MPRTPQSSRVARKAPMTDAESRIFRDHLVATCHQSGISLTRDQVAAMVSHAEHLRIWNRKINLTAITDPRDMAAKHFADALVVHRFLNQETGILDLGSGAGFPGLPIQIYDPAVSWCLVDAVARKVSFLSHIIRTLGLTRTRAIHARAEHLSHDPGMAAQWDAVICRGLAPLEAFVSLARPLIRPCGRLYAMKGPGGPDEITPALREKFRIESHAYRVAGADRTFLVLSHEP